MGSLPRRRYSRTNSFLILACPAPRTERTRGCLFLICRSGFVRFARVFATNRLIAMIPLRRARRGGETEPPARFRGGEGKKKRRSGTQSGTQSGAISRAARQLLPGALRPPPLSSSCPSKLMHVSGIMQRLISLSLSFCCFFATARPMEHIG